MRWRRRRQRRTDGAAAAAGRPEAVVVCRQLEPRHAKGCALDTELRGGERDRGRSGKRRRVCGTWRRLRDTGFCGSSRTVTRTIMVSSPRSEKGRHARGRRAARRADFAVSIEAESTGDRTPYVRRVRRSASRKTVSVLLYASDKECLGHVMYDTCRLLSIRNLYDLNEIVTAWRPLNAAGAHSALGSRQPSSGPGAPPSRPADRLQAPLPPPSSLEARWRSWRPSRILSLRGIRCAHT